ncbi:MAG: AMP-binding protein, partial [Haliea sp.]
IDSRYSSTPVGLTIHPSDPAVIFYTSGSTGQPKGVVKSHRALLHRAWLCSQYEAINTTDRQSLLTYFTFASSEADCFGALLNGAALELFDVASCGFSDLRDWIDEREITLLHPPVVLFRRYLSILEGCGLHPSVRLVALAGETVTASDVELWRRHFATSCALQHRFSSTEAGNIAVACIEPFAFPASGALPPARSVEDKFLSVIDEDGSTLEKGNIGELVVCSAFLASGYWRREQETAEHFRIDAKNPSQCCFRTGDIVRLVDGRGLEFLGRHDTQVKIRGYRVEIREIENALVNLPSVKEAAVIAEPRLGANSLVSFVVMKQGESFRSEALRNALRS